MKYILLFMWLLPLISQSQAYTLDDTFYISIGNPDTMDVTSNDAGSFVVDMIFIPPAYGSVQIWDNKIIYTHYPAFMGTDSFSYIAYDLETSVVDTSTVYILEQIVISIDKPNLEELTPYKATNLLGQQIPINSRGLKILWYEDGSHRRVFQD